MYICNKEKEGVFMKKQLRTILAALVISSMMATTAFGAEMVYLNDYEGWEPNDSITAANQVSVTSVTKTDSTTFPNLGTTYYCALPVIITAEDNLLVFQVAEATQNGSIFMEGDILMPNGYTESTYPPADGVYPKGMSFTLTKPGIYVVRAGYGFPSGGVESVLFVGDVDVQTPQQQTKPPVTATTTTAKFAKTSVILNEDITTFSGYNINGNNYVKLRDFAQTLSNTSCRFDVSWDAANQNINLITKTKYSGPATAPATSGSDQTAYVYNKGLLVNGYTTDVDAYTINGNTYFKLRDLATLVDAYVYDDAGSKEIYVVTEM